MARSTTTDDVNSYESLFRTDVFQLAERLCDVTHTDLVGFSGYITQVSRRFASEATTILGYSPRLYMEGVAALSHLKYRKRLVDLLSDYRRSGAGQESVEGVKQLTSVVLVNLVMDKDK
jgi:hypothetical protein